MKYELIIGALIVSFYTTAIFATDAISLKTKEYPFILDKDIDLFRTTEISANEKWHITSGWNDNKDEYKIERPPEGFVYCRHDQWQEGNHGGLVLDVREPTLLKFRLWTRGSNTLYNQVGGWQKGWYKILWIDIDAPLDRYLGNCKTSFDSKP